MEGVSEDQCEQALVERKITHSGKEARRRSQPWVQGEDCMVGLASGR